MRAYAAALEAVPRADHRHRIELPGSSDRPVVDGAPLRGIHDMVNRRTDSGRELAPHEALTPAQALRAYTYGSAHATFFEGHLGSLEPGDLTDLTVLSDDLTTVAPERIRDIEVLATVIEGRAAFDATGRWDTDPADAPGREA